MVLNLRTTIRIYKRLTFSIKEGKITEYITKIKEVIQIKEVIP